MSASVHRPSWRSLLFVPVTAPRFVERARERGADAIVLDLEDGVAADRKEEARLALSVAVKAVTGGHSDVLVRVNSSLLAIEDLRAAVQPGVTAVVLPKARSPDHVQMVAEAIGELEHRQGLPAGGVGLLPLVETCEALPRLTEIARADPRVVALALGDEDLSSELGCGPGSETLDNLKPKLVIAAAAAGRTPLGLMGSIAEYRDLSAFRTAAERARQVGLRGSFCVHPLQVPILNAAFAPSEGEREAAHRIVASFEAALAAGQGAAALHGRMIDAPIPRRARRMLEMADPTLSDSDAKSVAKTRRRDGPPGVGRT